MQYSFERQICKLVFAFTESNWFLSFLFFSFLKIEDLQVQIRECFFAKQVQMSMEGINEYNLQNFNNWNEYLSPSICLVNAPTPELCSQPLLHSDSDVCLSGVYDLVNGMCAETVISPQPIHFHSSSPESIDFMDDTFSISSFQPFFESLSEDSNSNPTPSNFDLSKVCFVDFLFYCKRKLKVKIVLGELCEHLIILSTIYFVFMNFKFIYARLHQISLHMSP